MSNRARPMMMMPITMPRMMYNGSNGSGQTGMRGKGGKHNIGDNAKLGEIHKFGLNSL